MNALNPKNQEQYWSAEGGDIWLQNLRNFESMIAPIGHVLIEEALTGNHKNIIDIGCGGGVTTFEIAKSIGTGGSIIGVDISQSLITDCSNRADNQGIKNIEFVCGDAASIELPKEWADLIISRFGVMFFNDPVAAFTHIAKSLTPYGALAFSCWAPLPENPWMNKLLTILGKYTALPKPEPGAPGPFAYSNPDYIRSILTSAGYKNIDVKAWSGELLIGMPGMSPEEAARFLFSSSSLVRAVKNNIVDQEAIIFAEFTQELATYFKNGGVYMPARSWIISAVK